MLTLTCILILCMTNMYHPCFCESTTVKESWGETVSGATVGWWHSSHNYVSASPQTKHGQLTSGTLSVYKDLLVPTQITETRTWYLGYCWIQQCDHNSPGVCKQQTLELLSNYCSNEENYLCLMVRYRCRSHDVINNYFMFANLLFYFCFICTQIL